MVNEDTSVLGSGAEGGQGGVLDQKARSPEPAGLSQPGVGLRQPPVLAKLLTRLARCAIESFKAEPPAQSPLRLEALEPRILLSGSPVGAPRIDASQALLGVQSGIALDQALRQAVSSGETQVRSTRRGLEVGVRTRVDVLNVEQQLFATRRDMSAARYQTLISGLLLKAAAGAIREQDLKSLDALLKE